MTDQFPIIPIEADIELPETLGTKEKFWVSDADEKLSLVKFGRDGTGEDWAEKVACELSQLLGIAHAHYDLASFKGRRCVVTPNLVSDGGRLVLGNELINRSARGSSAEPARTYLQREHTLSRVLAALAVNFRPDYRPIWHQFIGYLMLDAWIGNTDRHHENWGVIRSKDGVVSLAPTFDHASSLGRELTDQTRAKRLTTTDVRYSVEAFAGKARSALFADADDVKPLALVDAFAMASRVQRESGLQWLDRLAAVTDREIGVIFDKMPNTVMSGPSKEFARRLLAANKVVLLALRNPIR